MFDAAAAPSLINVHEGLQARHAVRPVLQRFLDPTVPIFT